MVALCRVHTDTNGYMEKRWERISGHIPWKSMENIPFCKGVWSTSLFVGAQVSIPEVAQCAPFLADKRPKIQKAALWSSTSSPGPSAGFPRRLPRLKSIEKHYIYIYNYIACIYIYIYVYQLYSIIINYHQPSAYATRQSNFESQPNHQAIQDANDVQIRHANLTL